MSSYCTSNIPRCSVCGRRPAFYLRRASGERLCEFCLERSIMKHVKRVIGSQVGPKPREVFGVLLPPGRVGEGLVLASIMARLEKKYGGSVVIAYPESTSLLKVLKESVGAYFNVGLATYDYEALLHDDCMYTVDLMNLANRLAEGVFRGFEPRVRAVALPFTLTDINEAGIESLFMGRKITEDLTGKSHLVSGMQVVYPLMNIQRIDIVAYLVGHGMGHVLNYFSINYCMQLYDVKRMIAEITLEHSELAYRMVKSFRAIEEIEEITEGIKSE